MPPTPTIYRIGIDIYDANTNQLLTPSSFQPFANNPNTIDLGQAQPGQQYNAQYGAFFTPSGPGTEPPVPGGGGGSEPGTGTGTGNDLDEVIRRYSDNLIPTLGDALGGVDEAGIRADARSALQGDIDLLNEEFAGKLAAEGVKGEGRLGQRRAISSRSGILGQDFGKGQKAKVVDFNQQQVDFINQQKAVRLAALFDRVDERSEREIERQRENTVLTFEDEQRIQTEARDDIKVLAGTGASLASLSDDDYESLFRQTGYATQDIFEAAYDSQKPTAQQIDWDKRVVGNTLIWSGIDPVTGELKTLEFTVPGGTKDLLIIDGVPYNQIEQEDGTITLEKAEGFEGEDLEGQTVQELRDEYFDAGILLTDSVQEAQQKVINNSAIYRKKVRIPPSGKTPSTDPTLDEDKTDMTNQLQTVVGSDGFVSPADYLTAKQAWVAQGLDPGDFDFFFSQFRNPDNQDYDIT